MQPRFENSEEKRLIGKTVGMSFSENKTSELWRSFLPRRKEIKNVIGLLMYSVEVYPEGFFVNFSPGTQFEKWAAVEVPDFDSIPENLEKLVLPAGLYAVFLHQGAASKVPETYQYILNTWFPQNSNLVLDNRPHIAVMGPKYKNEAPDSEEEIWIPIRNNVAS